MGCQFDTSGKAPFQVFNTFIDLIYKNLKKERIVKTKGRFAPWKYAIAYFPRPNYQSQISGKRVIYKKNEGVNVCEIAQCEGFLYFFMYFSKSVQRFADFASNFDWKS